MSKLFPQLIIVLALFIYSCNTNNANEIALFNEYKFSTNKAEQVATIDTTLKAIYKKHFNNVPGIQVPLYRVVSGVDYTIFIGIPYRVSSQKFAMAKQKDNQADSIISRVIGKGDYFVKYKRGNILNTEYFHKLDSGSVVCIFAITENQAIFDTLFSQEKLSLRVIK